MTDHQLSWKGDDEHGWAVQVGDRYYSVTRYMTAPTGRGKNKRPGRFIYEGHCLDVPRISADPKLIRRHGERVPWSTVEDPYGGARAQPPWTADEAKALCEADLAKRLQTLEASS
jgi:hypothetical protein